MFEGLVAKLLNKYLGKFCKNVDSEQLKISVFSGLCRGLVLTAFIFFDILGEVTLKDVEVKASGLDFLRLPLSVLCGSVGRIHLKAKWTALGSEPVRITLENVFVIAGPKEDFSGDEKEELAYAIDDKKSKLEADEADFLEREKNRAEGKKDDEDSFTARLTEKIIDNIQIIIKNIHIRYQDMRNPLRPIVGGLFFLLFL
jgi:vacuolar protein sorting-associated protein 13A/C